MAAERVLKGVRFAAWRLGASHNIEVGRRPGSSSASVHALMWWLAGCVKRVLRWMLVSYLVLLTIILTGALTFHWWASRTEGNFEKAISWSTHYILTPGSMVERGDLPDVVILPASVVQPVARVIEKIFIDSVDYAPASRAHTRDAHAYWQGRLLQAMASTYGKLKLPVEQLDRSRRAIAVFADLTVREPTRIEYRRRLARSYQLLAEDLIGQGQYDPALPHLRSVRRVSQGLLADQPGFWRWRWYLAMAHLSEGQSLAALDRSEEARAAFAAGLLLALGLRAEQPNDERWSSLQDHLAAGQSKVTATSHTPR
jgi:tetratricopeptide (TPR) repeat protein